MNLYFGAVNLDSAPPTDPYLPQLWVDETGNRLCYWSGTSWQVLPIAVKAGENISVAQNADGSVTVTGTSVNFTLDRTNGLAIMVAATTADGGSSAACFANNITHRNAVSVQADNGLAVRNLADNADAAVTCGQITITSPTVPATSSDTGIAGQIAWDAAFFYVCTATNTWVRTALTTW